MAGGPVGAVAMPCSCIYWTTHHHLLNVGGGGIGNTQLFRAVTAGQRLGGGGRGWPLGLGSCTGQLCPMLTSTFLLLSHGTLRPSGGGSALAAEDGGGVARPGCPPACTCATLASLRTSHRCGSPGARLLGRPPEVLCAVCTWPPPAFSPDSRGPSGTPSRHLWVLDSQPRKTVWEARLPQTLGYGLEVPSLPATPRLTPSPMEPMTLRLPTSGSPHLLQGVQHPRSHAINPTSLPDQAL